jgi:rare lipoprotein A
MAPEDDDWRTKTMRTIAKAALTAALFIMAGIGGAWADGWSDTTSYRNLRWGGSTPDYQVRSSETHRVVSRTTSTRAARTRSAAAAVVASDEDRPQRRSRTARTERAPERRSVAAYDGGGGATGVASYYWQPQRVASGGWFNPNAMTAAHKTLPFGTRVRVTNVSNGRSVDVTINDRGPYIAGRIIDLSRAAASAINMTGQGIARVKMTVIGR